MATTERKGFTCSLSNNISQIITITADEQAGIYRLLVSLAEGYRGPIDPNPTIDTIFDNEFPIGKRVEKKFIYLTCKRRFYQDIKRKMQHEEIHCISLDDSIIEPFRSLAATERLVDPQAELSKQVFWEEIESILSHDNNMNSEIVALRICDEMTFSEIAKIYDLSSEAIRQRFNRAMSTLRKSLTY